MNALITLLILTIPPDAPTGDGRAEEVEVYRCDFETATTDRNYDLWPDQWTRKVGPGYPPYLDVEITQDDKRANEPDNNAVELALNGGAAAIFSPMHTFGTDRPMIPIRSQFSYLLQGSLRTEGLRHDVAYLSITLFDRDNKRIATYQSEELREAKEWTNIKVGPITPTESQAMQAVIGLHVRPTGRKADLGGRALFDNLRVTRLPRMTLNCNKLANIFFEPKDIEISCEVSGILEHDPLFRFSLLDHDGKVLAKEEQPLHESIRAQRAEGAQPRGMGLSEVIRWQPPIKSNGFYIVRATLQGRDSILLERDIGLTVLEEQGALVSGPFGWSLPKGEERLEIKQLLALLSQAGVNWVKYPVWSVDYEDARADQIDEFVEYLRAENINMVAVLDQPPARSLTLFSDSGRIPIASVFVDPDLWQPLVDPVMNRLSMKVRWWQLGNDSDTSYVGFPELEARIAEVKHHLEQFGQNVELGFGWDWLHESPQSQQPTWGFISFTEHPPFTQKQLADQLTHEKSETAKNWVTLEPLDRDEYSLEIRIRDLVTRMLAAKIGGADGIFAPDPLNPKFGLVRSDGAPGELYLPWRMTAASSSGAKFIGSIQMPGGSQNFVFARDGEAIMFVWNDQPVTETIFLGHDVGQVDMWGRKSKPGLKGHRQVIQVGRTPTILTGVSEEIAKWRIGFSFDPRPLASVFGQQQITSVRFKNTFKRGIGGQFRLIAPDEWETQRRFELKVPEDGDVYRPFPVVLTSVARTGEQHVRVDFVVSAELDYKFSIYRTMQVGLGDVVIEVETNWTAKGDLEVVQHLINQTDQFVSFDCWLYVPSHPRQRVQVINTARGRNTQKYIIANAKELNGKTLWLRAEEIDGTRVLNYHVKVEQ